MAGLNLDLGSILQQSSDFASSLDDSSSQLSEAVSAGSTAMEAKQRMSQEAADAAAVKASADVTEVARQESGRQAILARLNMDPSKQGSVLLQKSQEIMEADAGLAAASQAIKEKSSINPILNPLGWAAAKLTVNGDVENYNFYARQKNRAEDTRDAMVKSTTDAFAISNAASSTVTEAYISAQKVLASYQYNIQAQEAAAQGARWNMDGIMHSVELGRDQLAVMYSANNAQMQEKNYQIELSRLRLSTQQAALAQEEFGLRKEQFGMQKAAFNEKNADDAVYSKYIRDGYFNMTGQVMDPAKNTQMLALLRTKNPDVLAWMESGMQSSAVTGGTSNKPVINLSPYKAADLVGTGKVQNMSPDMMKVGEQLVTWRRAFESPSVQTQYPFDAKDKNSKELAFNKYVDDQKKQAQGSVNESSIFAPHPLDKVAAIKPEIAALPVWNKVLGPASKAGINVNDPNIAFSMVTAAMREGKISYQDAAELPAVYAGALDVANQSRNFMAFGLSPVRTYNAQISVPGSMGKTGVNLVDKNSFMTALNRANAARGFNHMRGDSGLGMLPINSTDIPAIPMPNVQMPEINSPDIKFGPKPTFPGDEEARYRNIRLRNQGGQ